MTLGPFDWLWILLPPLLLGYGLLRWLQLDVRRAGVAWPAWLWAAGAVAHTQLLLLWILFGTLPDATLLAATELGLGLLLVGAARWSARRALRTPAAQPAPAPAPPPERGTRLLYSALVVGLLLFGLQILRANQHPVTFGDEAAIWSAKAKVLYASGGEPHALQQELSEQEQPFVLHPDYPMLNPLLQLQVFLQAGGITHVANRLPVQLGALALLCALAGALRARGAGRTGAVLLLAVAVSAPALEIAGLAMSDLMLALGAVLLADGWLRAQTQQDASGWRLAAIGAAVLVSSKNEGLLVLVAFALLAAIARRGRVPREPWLLLPLLLFGTGLWFNLRHGLRSDMFAPDLPTAVARIFTQFPAHGPDVLRWFSFDILLEPAHSCGLLLAAVLLLVLRGRRGHRDELPVVAAPALVLVIYMLVFTGTPHVLSWHLSTAAARIAFHVVPLAALAVAVAVAQPRAAATN